MRASYDQQAFQQVGLYCSLLHLFLQVTFLHAQQLATLSVTVTDPSGRVVPGAQVTLDNTKTGLSARRAR